MTAVPHDALFDAAAEALIMLDTSHPDSLRDLVDRISAIRDHFGTTDAEHPAQVLLALAERLVQGDTGVVADLERAFASARALADSAAKPKKPAKKAPPKERAAKTDAKASASANAEAERLMPLAGDEDLLRDFAIRTNEHLDDADDRLLALEADPGSTEAIDAILRAFHTIKGMAGFLALDDISQQAHDAESILSEAHDAGHAVEAESIQATFTAVDRLRGLVFASTGIGRIPEAAAASDAGATNRRPAEAVSAGAATVRFSPEGADAAGMAANSREGSIRVEEQRLDRLLDVIGEMVIAESTVSAALRGGADIASMSVQLDRLDKITREMQQMATSLRMVPLRTTFRRMGRLVRDTALKAGKSVEFVLIGEDTELDKEVVDRISDPLIHALRNAVDHGIESAAERVAAGKPETGLIELRAFHAGGVIHIEVTDDGRGLDSAAIVQRAREFGLMDAEEVRTDADIRELIFEPGLSTAKTVTDVSGRGVGMDVVRRTVDGLRGRVEIDTAPGRGTTLSIQLPITLAIIDGMVARIGEERYIIPVLSIERSVRPEASQVKSVKGSGEMLVTEDGLIPIVRLHRLFSTPGACERAEDAVLVIAGDSGSRAALLVCELLGQQQTVIKPLGDGIPPQRGITGGAIMSDGRVGLILDAAGLVRLARERVSAGHAAGKEGA